MTEVLVFNGGAELYGYAESQGGKLYLYIHGKTLAEAKAVLNDPEQTRKITSRRNDGTHVYKSYTRAAEIREVSGGFVTATMEKP